MERPDARAEQPPTSNPTAERAARYDWFARYPADHERAGQQVTRESLCERCDAPFTQWQLSDLFRDVVQRRSLFAERVLDRELPDGWTPRLCPRCERAQIERVERTATQAAHGE